MPEKQIEATRILRTPSKHRGGEWQKKVATARQAREEAQRRRAGKKTAFSVRHVPGIR
jgi:hypothetical protein